MSKESIIRELPEDFVRKMRDWVRSRTGNGFAMTSAYEGLGPSSGYAEIPIPIIYGAVADIDVAMLKIELREREGVRLFWIYEGNSLSWLARRIGVKRQDTAEARVRHGHNLLREQLRVDAQAHARYHEHARNVGAFT